MERATYDWRQRAACRDSDPEVFFPITEDVPDSARVAQAKAICASCPVQSECLDFALDNRLDHGVFGGMTAGERRRIMRRRRVGDDHHSPAR
ncbi:WhiB family transcriptional regulator [Haloechinothrix sp. YIM 98757]|uniref:Transcriptional regulator WhiB n=1 Tax=Haloechinothrix aidingensis TaxID=2752311 RepID=A0A837ZXW0_9PSEU|nr:WhiB family transcriptional regulator [Haloechinothrix aidingensis]MBA0125004.1 WhiB family transcriptional regulator [Haloechinothrix aidingensis]